MAISVGGDAWWILLGAPVLGVLILAGLMLLAIAFALLRG
jgi:hypothetical protein